MKKIIKLGVIVSLSCGLIILIMSFKNKAPNPESNEFIIVQIFENPQPPSSSIILIIEGEEVLEKIELKTNRPKHYEENYIVISKTLNKIKEKGYSLISSHGSGGDLNTGVQYIFEKE